MNLRQSSVPKKEPSKVQRVMIEEHTLEVLDIKDHSILVVHGPNAQQIIHEIAELRESTNDIPSVTLIANPSGSGVFEVLKDSEMNAMGWYRVPTLSDSFFDFSSDPSTVVDILNSPIAETFYDTAPSGIAYTN
ncbi:MAG: hypothetical protein GY861_05905 [bacterium]|nr:hypothetical protein [bacterium]